MTEQSPITTMIPTATDDLPDVFEFRIERKPDGWWKVTAPDQHVGCYLVGMDLQALIADAPSVLNELIRRDGKVSAT